MTALMKLIWTPEYIVVNFQNIWDIAEEYPEVDRCIECSAKSLINVSEMFYNAQKAVLHPINPIYSIEEQEVSYYQFNDFIILCCGLLSVTEQIYF